MVAVDVIGLQRGDLLFLDPETGAELRRVALHGSIHRLALDPEAKNLAVTYYPERTLSVYTWPELIEVLSLDWLGLDSGWEAAFGRTISREMVLPAAPGDTAVNVRAALPAPMARRAAAAAAASGAAPTRPTIELGPMVIGAVWSGR